MSQPRDDIAQVMQAIWDAPYVAPQPIAVHPTEYVWISNPIGPAPSANAVNVALGVGAIGGDHSEVWRLIRERYGDPS